MPLRALGGTALLTVLDWGVWHWASDAGHSTVSMIAGIILVPAGVALVGLLGITLVSLGRVGVRSVAERRRDRAASRDQPPTAPASGDVGRAGSRRDRVAV